MEHWHEMKQRHRDEEAAWVRAAVAHYGRAADIARGEGIPATTVASILKRYGLRRKDRQEGGERC